MRAANPDRVVQKTGEHGVLLIGSFSVKTPSRAWADSTHQKLCKRKRPRFLRPVGNFFSRSGVADYFGWGPVVAGLVAAGAAGLVVAPVPAGLVVTGRVGAGTPDCAL